LFLEKSKNSKNLKFTKREVEALSHRGGQF
jgi:hypothetical protein